MSEDIIDKKQSLTINKDELIAENDASKLQEYVDIFNNVQVKKDLIRAINLNDLQDKVDAELLNRIQNKPDELTTKELVEINQYVSSNIDKARNNLNNVDNKPLIQINNTTINTDSNQLNRAERERVLDFINDILNSSNTEQTNEVQELDFSNQDNKENN